MKKVKEGIVIVISIVGWIIGLFVLFSLIGIGIHYGAERTLKGFSVSNVSESDALYQIANGTIKKGNPFLSEHCLFGSALMIIS